MPAKKSVKKAAKKSVKKPVTPQATEFIRPKIGFDCCQDILDHIGDNAEDEADPKQQAAKIMELVASGEYTLPKAYIEARRTTEVNPSILAADILKVLFLGTEPSFKSTTAAIEKLKRVK